MPHPIVRQNDELGGEHEQTHEVEMRLVVAQDDRWPTKILAAGVLYRSAHLGEVVHSETSHAVKHTMVSRFFTIRFFAQSEHHPSYNGQSKTQDEEIRKRIDAYEQIAEWYRHAASFPARRRQETKKKGRKNVRHNYHGKHPHHGYLAEGTTRWVTGKNHRTHAHKHNGGRKGYAVFV